MYRIDLVTLHAFREISSLRGSQTNFSEEKVLPPPTDILLRSFGRRGVNLAVRSSAFLLETINVPRSTEVCHVERNCIGTLSS